MCLHQYFRPLWQLHWARKGVPRDMRTRQLSMDTSR